MLLFTCHRASRVSNNRVGLLCFTESLREQREQTRSGAASQNQHKGALLDLSCLKVPLHHSHPSLVTKEDVKLTSNMTNNFN